MLVTAVDATGSQDDSELIIIVVCLLLEIKVDFESAYKPNCEPLEA